MLDTFRKRENPRPTTPGTPGLRPSSPAHSNAPAHALSPAASAPRVDTAPAKPVLLEPAAPPVAPPSAPVAATPPDAPAPEQSSMPPSAARLTVGPDIKLKGAEITDCDTLIVEGQVDASMDSRVVEIAENGVFRGKVQVEIAEIRGRFEGELTVHKQLMIRETGRVAGKIRYGKICIDEGGEVSGDVAATESEASPQSKLARAPDSRGTREAASGLVPPPALAGSVQR